MSQGFEHDVRRLVAAMFLEAYRADASDIHLECLERELRLRYRIDRRWYPAPHPPPKRLQPPLLGHLKSLAGLPTPLEQAREGCIRLYMAERNVDLIASACPTAFGESWFLEMVEYPL